MKLSFLTLFQPKCKWKKKFLLTKLANHAIYQFTFQVYVVATYQNLLLKIWARLSKKCELTLGNFVTSKWTQKLNEQLPRSLRLHLRDDPMWTERHQRFLSWRIQRKVCRWHNAYNRITRRHPIIINCSWTKWPMTARIKVQPSTARRQYIWLWVRDARV